MTPQQALGQEFSAYYNADELVLKADDAEGIDRQAEDSADRLSRMVGAGQVESLADSLDEARLDPNGPLIALIRKETNLAWAEGGDWPLLQALLERIAAHVRSGRA
jgi:hypothetical protein